jgi:tryptophanyl-tRNA synthetase
MAEKYASGISWADAKAELFALMNSVLSPMREKYNYYKQNYDLVEQIIRDGSARAQKVAKETILRARQNIGLD